jgi:hypothetical protein
MRALPNVIATLTRHHFNGLGGPPVVGASTATHEGISCVDGERQAVFQTPDQIRPLRHSISAVIEASCSFNNRRFSDLPIKESKITQNGQKLDKWTVKLLIRSDHGYQCINACSSKYSRATRLISVTAYAFLYPSPKQIPPPIIRAPLLLKPNTLSLMTGITRIIELFRHALRSPFEMRCSPHTRPESRQHPSAAQALSVGLGGCQSYRGNSV